MKKLFILLAVLAAIAMLLPVAAVSVSANTGSNGAVLGPDPQHDIAGDTATFTVTNLPTGVTVTSFGISQVAGSPATIINHTATTVTVQATGVGEATVIAYLSDEVILTAVKKWGEIDATIINPPQQNQAVSWNESAKTFFASANITDTVVGSYLMKDEDPTSPTYLQYVKHEHFNANGAILYWYLLADNPTNEALVAAAAGSLNQVAVTALMASLSTAQKATFATFGPIQVPPLPVVSTQTTVSGDLGPDGQSMVTVNTNGEEPVLVVVLPWYQISTQYTSFLEWAKINFWTVEMEKVPQVRWAGEKIVLEKFFGPVYAGQLVRFSLESQSPGSLEGLEGTQLGNLNNTADTIWDVVSTTGWARCMLVSEAPGEVDVDLALYNVGDGAGVPGNSKIVNQHGFVVFYLKLESITLGNVSGKRASHDSGLFDPANPFIDSPKYDPTLESNTDDIFASVNVSSDTLLRARVRGWFMGDNDSTRLALIQDANNASVQYQAVQPPTAPSVYTYTLPAGRWVLPDDWPILAGPNWKEMRIHWDIMDDPFDTVRQNIPPNNAGKGPYYKGTTLVAAYPVIGPFTPELEIPTATGYNPNLGNKPYRFGFALPGLPATTVAQYKTVVPNGVLDWWDAPMPPAKITFALVDADLQTTVSGNRTIHIGDAGFFKDAFKTDIYYLTGPNNLIQWTSPFYWEYIPANFEIPAIVNNGGYDWDSWNAAYGPYQFWKIINRPMNEMMPSSRPMDNANFPSKVQVYSDNHGEAMVYLNGNFALNTGLFTFKGLDVPFGSTVGSSSVVAIADYPYFRKHVQIMSNLVVKNWTWGGMVLGPTQTGHTMILSVGDYTGTDTLGPGGIPLNGTSKDKMVWVWATDRDGRASGVDGTQVDWSITPVGTLTAIIPDLTTLSTDSPPGVSNYNATMRNINITHGFLDNTNGGVFGTPAGFRSWMRPPTSAEKDLFNKFWGAGGTQPIVDAFGDPVNPANFVVAAIDLFDASGLADVTVNAFLQSPDFGTLAYTWNVDFHSSHPLDDVAILGDANLDGKVNVADITAIESIILGLDGACYQADANGNGHINMGDVVKAERIILGMQ